LKYVKKLLPINYSYYVFKGIKLNIERNINMNNYLNNLARNDDEKRLMARLADLVHKAAVGTYGQSDFLDLRQQELARAVSVNNPIISWKLNGGYEEAERKRLIVYPEWCLEADAKITYLQISYKDYKEQSLGHRDYLGALLNLGVKREKLGDIVVYNCNAFLIADTDIADFINNQLTRVKHSNVWVQIIDKEAFVFEPPILKTLQVTLASLRLDAAVAAAFNLSRSDANSTIESGNVKLNQMDIYKSSTVLKPGDLISVRGRGRFKIDEVGGLSRKGRYHMQISCW